MSTTPSFNNSNGDHHHSIPVSSTSHPDNPIPEEPRHRSLSVTSARFNALSIQEPTTTDATLPSAPLTPPSEPQDEVQDDNDTEPTADGGRRASTVLISQNSDDMRRILENVGQSGTQKLQPLCCGGGCCRSQPLQRLESPVSGSNGVIPPNNDAFRSLQLNTDYLTLEDRKSVV